MFQNLISLVRLMRPPCYRELLQNEGRTVSGAKLGSNIPPPVDWEKRQSHVIDAFFHERLSDGWSAQKRGGRNHRRDMRRPDLLTPIVDRFRKSAGHRRNTDRKSSCRERGKISG